MIYTTSLRQINYIASWMDEYSSCVDEEDPFERKLKIAIGEFIEELKRLNVLENGLMENEKHRKLSLFGENLKDCKNYFGEVYVTNYKGTFAQLAQAHRHRTLNYKMERLVNKEYYVPKITKDNNTLVDEWIRDIKSVADVVPQGEIINIYESGTYDNFILKCKERLCSAPQLEIMIQTKEILNNYKKSLENTNHPLAKDIVKYTKGARCTFLDFKCCNDCKFKEGKLLTREV